MELHVLVWDRVLSTAYTAFSKLLALPAEDASGDVKRGFRRSQLACMSSAAEVEFAGNSKWTPKVDKVRRTSRLDQFMREIAEAPALL
jgi:hypothetical protein